MRLPVPRINLVAMSSALLSQLPAPEKWKMVVPHTWTAAIPVVAVTNVVLLGRMRTSCCTKKDFPVPAPPVINTDAKVKI